MPGREPSGARRRARGSGRDGGMAYFAGRFRNDPSSNSAADESRLKTCPPGRLTAERTRRSDREIVEPCPFEPSLRAHASMQYTLVHECSANSPIGPSVACGGGRKTDREVDRMMGTRRKECALAACRCRAPERSRSPLGEEAGASIGPECSSREGQNQNSCSMLALFSVVSTWTWPSNSEQLFQSRPRRLPAIRKARNGRKAYLALGPVSLFR